MKTALARSVAFLLFLLAYSTNGFSGSSGNGASQHNAAAHGQNAAPAPAQNTPAANPQNSTPANGQNAAVIPGLNAPAPAGAIMLNATPLGAINGTGGGHYNPLPVIFKGGARTLLVVPNGSRVQAYVDGVAGPVVNAIPITQTLPQPLLGCTNGSPQFSADQKRVAYIVDLDNNKHAVVVDGTMSPAYDRVETISFAPVGHHFAYTASRTTGGPNQQYATFVVDDGKAGKIYSQGCGPAVFSPDGNHVAYVGSVYSKGLTPIEVQEKKKTPQNMCVVLDGVEQKHFAKIEQLTFSQDSKHVAYIAGIDQLSITRAVIDDKDGPEYVGGVKDLVVSDDGSRSAYVATKTITQPNSQSQSVHFVVDNGKEGEPYDLQISHLSVSHDGQRVAYVAQGYKTNTVIVENGKASQQYRGCDTLKFSPDSKTLLYIPVAAQGSFIVVNGKEYGPFSGINSEPAFSKEDGHWACCVSTGDQKFAILSDGKMIALDRIAPGPLAYQPGTGQLTMKSTTSTSGAPVVFEVKGDTISAADVPSAIAYSPNHQHIVKVLTSGYGTSEVKQKIAIDDQPPSDAKYAGINNIAVSDDGKHVAFIDSYIGENGKALTHAIYDATEGPGYWGIKDIALSPDGLHVAYVAQKSNTKGLDTFVVIDGMEGPALQDVLIDGAYSGQGFGANDVYREVRFSQDGSLHFLAVINGQLYRASYPAEAFKGLPSMATHESEKPGPREMCKIDGPGLTHIYFILGPDETIYGISRMDGKFKHGKLYKIKNDGNDYAVLKEFYGGDDDGENPSSIILTQDGSAIIGVFERKMFRYDLKTQAYNVTPITGGDNPPFDIAGYTADGSLIGTAGHLAQGDQPGLFSMKPDGSNYKTYPNNEYSKTGRVYSKIIQGKNGTFFAVGRAKTGAALFMFKNLTDEPTVIHQFKNSPTDGNNALPNLVLDSAGNLYGSTGNGGNSQKGIIYKVSPDGSKYEVIYNPDNFDFPQLFAPADDGTLYGVGQEGLFKVAPGGNKAESVLPFKGADFTSHHLQPELFWHHGALLGRANKMLYRITPPPAGGATAAAGSAAPTVAINVIQPQPLAGEAITITDPTGAASAGTAVSSPAQQQTNSQQQQQQPSSQQSPQNTPPPPTPEQSKYDKVVDKAKKAEGAANKLKGLFGH